MFINKDNVTRELLISLLFYRGILVIETTDNYGESLIGHLQYIARTDDSGNKFHLRIDGTFCHITLKE